MEALVLLGMVVFLGAVVQASVGFGVGTLAGPIAAILDPSLMPEAILIVGGALPLLTLSGEWRHVDFSGLGWAFLGRVPGTLAGAYVVVLISARQLAAVIAITVLFAVVLSTTSVRLRPTQPNLAVAGAVSGFTGTAAGIGGPPMALVYQREGGPRTRANLAAFFLVGVLASLLTLLLAGEVDQHGVSVGLLALPLVAGGHIAARPLRRYLNPQQVRAGVLLVSAIGAVTLLATTAV